MSRAPSSSFLCAALLLACSASLHASQWVGFLNNNADEPTWTPASYPADFTATDPKQVWSKSVGKGFGGIAVAKGFLFFLDRTVSPSEIETLRCYSSTDGSLVWEKSWPVTYGEMGGYSTGPRTTPLVTTIGSHLAVIALGATGQLVCVNASDGKTMWEMNTVTKLGAEVPQWGFAGSPMIWSDKLYLHLGLKDGGSVVCFEPETGNLKWKGGNEKAGYCTPMISTLHGSPTLIQWGPDHVEAMDPNTGKMIWTFPYKITYGVSIAQPIVRDEQVLVSGYWHGTRVISPPNNVASGTALLKWSEEKKLCGLMSTPLEKDGFVYLLDKNSGFNCFKLSDGSILWNDENQLTPKDRNPHATVVWLDKKRDLVALLNASGELVYATFKPTGFDELARHQIIGKTWAPPAFVDNMIFARSDTTLVAWKLWD